MDQLRLTLTTLTPLWTGGADRTVDRLHETGLLGSLRWWYEALVRGVGGHVCDSGTCTYDSSQKPNDALCDVCRVFGATGWRRRFRLTVEDTTQSTTGFPNRISLPHHQYTKNSKTRTPTWYFELKNEDPKLPPIPNPPRSGHFEVGIQPLAPDFNPAIIAGLIQFMADWAAIGARPQMGFGVVQVKDERVGMQPLYNHLRSLKGTSTYPHLPSLATMFFTRVAVTSNRREETFNLKYDLRALFRTNQKVRHFVMGTVQDKRIAAKVKMSHPYQMDSQLVMRVWGWIPQLPNDYGMNRSDVIGKIHDHIRGKYTVHYWREFNSPRDTVHPNQTNMPDFLHSLMKIEEPQP